MLPSLVLAISVALSGCALKNRETGEIDVIRDEEQLEFMFTEFLFASFMYYENQRKSSTPTAPSSSANTFAGRQAAMGDVSTRTRYRFGSGIRSPGADAPASGTAVYKGNANLRMNQLSPDSFAIGQAQIDADFTQNTISGRIDNFLNPSDGAVAGTITLANGKITRANRPNDAWTDDAISADLSGNLDVSGSNTSVSGSMIGSFREGQDPEPIIPPGRYITGNINLTTGGSVPIYGGFTATRQ